MDPDRREPLVRPYKPAPEEKRVKRPWLKLVSRHADRRLAARVAGALRLREPFYVVPLNRETRRLRKRLQRTVAPVYARATA